MCGMQKVGVEWKGVNGCMCSGCEGRSVIEGRVKGVHVHQA